MWWCYGVITLPITPGLLSAVTVVCVCLFFIDIAVVFLNVLKLKRQNYHIYGIIGRCFLKVKLTSTSCKSSYLQRNSGQNRLFDREIRYVGVVRGLGSRPLLTKENQHFSSASANKTKKEKKEEEAKQVFLFNPENTVRWEQHKAGGGWRYIKSWSIFKFQILNVCVQTGFTRPLSFHTSYITVTFTGDLCLSVNQGEKKKKKTSKTLAQTRDGDERMLIQ